MAFGPARREGQHRVEPVQRLNGGFLVDGEHDGIGRRGEIQADDVGRLRFEVRVVTRQIALEPVRLETRALPDAGDGDVTHPDQRRHATRGPVRQRRRGTLVGLGEDLRFDAGIQPVRTPTAGAIPQGEDALLHDAAFPLRDELVRHAMRRADDRIRLAIGQREDNAGAADQPRAQGRRSQHAGQNTPVIRRELEFHRRRKHASGESKMHAFHISVTVH